MSSSSSTTMSIITGPAVVSAEFHTTPSTSSNGSRRSSSNSSGNRMDDGSMSSSVHTASTTITSMSTSITVSNNESMIALLRETTIYLNNTAVTLLGTYNNYVAAIQTMKDALELLSKSINMSSTASSSQSNDQQNISLSTIYELHQRVISSASHRLQIESQKVGTELPISPEPHSRLPVSTSYHSHNDTEETPKMNEIGVVVLPSNFNPNDAYHLLATIRTSKVALRIVNDNQNVNHSNNDYYRNLHVVRSILVYNYGIAHRCCTPAPAPVSNHHSNDTNHHQSSNNNNNKVGTFCLQIFQYAEQLLLPALESNSNTSNRRDEQPQQQQQQPEALLGLSSNNSNNYILLYRFLLTRNLMMISCKMGMLLCELYKQTLDPIESEMLLLPPSPPTPVPSQLQQEQQQEGNGSNGHPSSSSTGTNDTQINASAA